MRILTVLLALISGAFTPVHAEDSPEWKQIGTAAGSITIYKKEIPGSDVLAYKAEGVLPAPMDKLVSVVADTERRSEWATRVKAAEVVEELSQTERVEYTHASTPWPLKDRDFLYEVRVHLDPERKSARFDMKSVPHPKKPPQSRVRGEIFDSGFTLTYVSAKRTHMIAEVHADPKGAIPKWIVNMVQKSMPNKALRGLLKQAAKPDIAGHPLVSDWMRR